MSAGEPVHESQRMAIEHLTQTIAFKHAMLTERDAEIARLNAALARVTAQRDKVARELHAECKQRHGRDDFYSTPKDDTAYADWFLKEVCGLRIENGEVKEIGE